MQNGDWFPTHFGKRHKALSVGEESGRILTECYQSVAPCEVCDGEVLRKLEDAGRMETCSRCLYIERLENLVRRLDSCESCGVTFESAEDVQNAVVMCQWCHFAIGAEPGDL